MIRRQWMRLVGAGLLSAFALVAQAADAYPDRVVKIVVPFAAGAGTDILARAVAQKLQEAWGQPVVVENKPGGDTIIGTSIVAKAPADGYTLLMASSSLASNQTLHSKLPYDIDKDLAPISMLATFPLVLVGNANLPVKNLADLIALARSKPGQIDYASIGNGSTPHLGMEMLKRLAGIDMVHVVYKGAAPALTDVLAGHVSVMLVGIPASIGHIQSGRLKALGISQSGGASSLPGVPGISETVPGFDFFGWYGLLAPAGTPPEVIDRIGKSVSQALETEDVLAKLHKLGYAPAPTTAAQFRKVIDDDMEKWGATVKAMGLRRE